MLQNRHHLGDKRNTIVWKKTVVRKKKKKILTKRSLFAAGILAAIVGIIGLTFFSPVFKIRRLIISGDGGAPRERLEAFIHSYFDYNRFLFIGSDNFLFLDDQKLTDHIKGEFPGLDTVSVETDIAGGALLIDCKEKKPVGIWCFGDEECFYLDKTGRIFADAPSTEGSLILLVKKEIAAESVEDAGSGPESSGGKPAGIGREKPKLGERVINEPVLDFIFDLRDEFLSIEGVSVNQYIQKPDGLDIEAVSGEGLKIYFDSQKSAAEQAANLKVLFEEKIKDDVAKIDYIDMREGDKIYYKSKE